MVEATIQRDGDVEVVAVKQLNYHEGTEIRKFSNVRITGIIAYCATLTYFT